MCDERQNIFTRLLVFSGLKFAFWRTLFRLITRIEYLTPSLENMNKKRVNNIAVSIRIVVLVKFERFSLQIAIKNVC